MAIARFCVCTCVYFFVAGRAHAQQVEDIDGNMYDIVKIGDQTWLKQNLKVTKYRNGDALITGLNNTDWASATNGAYAIYPHVGTGVSSEADMKAQYGVFYNWFAVNDPRGICPEGWKVASDDDWKQLEKYIGMSQAETDAEAWRGEKAILLKSTSWDGTDIYGFSVLAAGFRDRDGKYNYFGTRANFWTATEAEGGLHGWRRILPTYSTKANDKGINRSTWSKTAGNCIRCIMEATMPVKLLDFSIKSDNKETISITWLTASELNNDYFEVERSIDGVEFISIRKIKGKETGNRIQTYSVVDENPASGTNYYRLKQVDNDGKITTYSIKALNFGFEKTPTVTIYPNPASANIFLKLANYRGHKLTIRLMDMQGMIVHQEVIATEASRNDYPLNLTDLPAGEYLLRISGINLETTLKLIRAAK